MNPNMNSQGIPPNESLDSYHSFGSSPSSWQESPTRFRGQNYSQGPYPTSSSRIRQHGDFSQRGRYSYNKRGGGAYRSHIRDKNFDQQQEQSVDNNNEYQTTMINSSNRKFNSFFRTNMLEDPWINMKPTKVPSNGTSLVFDSANH
ncbi:unnamed protein product [Rotaria sordida]|uniref:Uncharacterized protein n=1 Tax=Rotaria sordida TaxID=392033 RepID=A0A813SN79_9BILA|nr:unnamed protein product [Rotaria sordida]CAF0759200.1 unnamed protein product [Rotaria sordida]CAF0796877.1 unnamed protein product [Rotaria sordida]CAF3477240.1 unnamed protein product [Rotaria sordida]